MQNQNSAVKTILTDQHQLKKVRGKVSFLHEKNIFIVSGDFAVREQIKAHLKTLNFQEKQIKSTNFSSEIVNKLKKNAGGLDLIICNMRILDIQASSQTGIQLLVIVRKMLLAMGIDEKIPFIFMEKKFERNEIIAAIKEGGNQFLVLPTDPIALANKLLETYKKSEETILSKELSTLLLEAGKLRDQGLFDEAITLYNNALKVSNKNLEILTEKANTLLEMGEVDEAIVLFKRIVELKDNFPRAHQGLGIAYEQLGDHEEAKKNYAKVLELEPSNVQVCHSIGSIFQKEGDHQSAGKYFNKGIKTNKKFVKNYFGLANSFQEQGQPIKGFDVFKKAMDANPNQIFIQITAGEYCLKNNLLPQAEELFSSALKQNDTHIHLYNRLGIVLRKESKFKEAIINYSKALTITGDDANLHYNKAKAHFFCGEEKTAIEILKNAFLLNPDLEERYKTDKPFNTLITHFPDKAE